MAAAPLNTSTEVVATAPPHSEDEIVQVLRNSLYPGARPESIRMVLAWCKANGRDPMKKPIHIVPMEVKDAATNRKEWRDVLMPGIGTYRTDAAHSGRYAGKGEPEFGPEITKDVDGMQVTFPQWCRVTVSRTVGGSVCHFTAKEFWLENYASGYQGKGVNVMWRKRPYGQLAKCAEAQALRMAFPEETGNTNTQEEMEGKTFDGVTIEHESPAPPRLASAAPPVTLKAQERVPVIEQPQPEQPKQPAMPVDDPKPQDPAAEAEAQARAQKKAADTKARAEAAAIALEKRIRTAVAEARTADDAEQRAVAVILDTQATPPVLTVIQNLRTYFRPLYDTHVVKPCSDPRIANAILQAVEEKNRTFYDDLVEACESVPA